MSDKVSFFSRFFSDSWRRIGLLRRNSDAEITLIQNDFHFTSGKIEDDLWIVISRPRSIGFSIILSFFVSVLLVGSIVKIDGGVTVAGQVMSLGGVSSVQSKSAGVIDRVHVRDGDHVDLGSLIISLDSRIAKENLSNALVTWCKLVFSEAKLIALEEVAESINIPYDVESRCSDVLKRVDYDNLFMAANKNHTFSVDAYMSQIVALENEANEVSAKIPIYEKKLKWPQKICNLLSVFSMVVMHRNIK